ncbi:hypothetical protein HK104_009761, partial [Borealophlyctis nickersoniae]
MVAAVARLHPGVYIAIWFIFSTSLIFTNRAILIDLAFGYPITLTSYHLLLATLATRCLRVSTRLLDGVAQVERKMGWRKWAACVLPIGILFSLSLALSNYAYMYITVAFIQILKSATPVAILLASWAFRTEKPDGKVFLNVFIISLGVAIASYGEIQFVFTGFLLMALAVAFESVRLVMVQRLLKSDDIQMDALVSLYYFAPVCAFFNLITAAMWEFPRLTYEQVANVGVMTFVANGILSFGLNVAAVSVVKQTSTLVLGLAGVVKDIMIVCVAIIAYHTPMTLTQAVGYMIALGGLVYYKTKKETFWTRLALQLRNDRSLKGSRRSRTLVVCVFMMIVVCVTFAFLYIPSTAAAAKGLKRVQTEDVKTMTAVIIERDPVANLVPVILHFLAVLGADWN